MKKLILLFICILCYNLTYSKINFSADYALFKSENSENFVEFYLNINGQSILYGQTSPNLYQAKLEVTYLIEQGENVVAFQKNVLKSPEYTENAIKLNLIDLKRLSFPEGSYTYTIIVKDLFSKESSQVSDKLRSLPRTETIQFSEIQLANQVTANDGEGAFVKNGFDIIPNVSHVYNTEEKNFVGYFEIYNANKSLQSDSVYLLDMRIEDATSSIIVSDLRAIKRMNVNTISPIVQQFKLDKVPNGNYNFVIEAKNRENKVIASQKTNFYRVNNSLEGIEELVIKGTFVDSIRNTAQLADYIKSLRPISNNQQVSFADNQLRYSDLEFMQRFFLNFWREKNRADPYFAWMEYKRKVDFVDREFGYGGVSGYTTSRGRVYLQYGAPNTLQDFPYGSETYAHSIWQYYKVDGYTNVRFVFYSPTNEMLGYDLIHSTYPGEPKNENWYNDISSKVTRPSLDPDQNQIIHRNSKDVFDNPR